MVDQNIGSSDAGDADEKEADAYAIRLLNGSYARYSPGPGSRIRNGAALYKAALVKANQERIDVGHIILNYGNTQNAHPLANAAIKLIPGEADGIKLVNKAFFQFLDDGKTVWRSVGTVENGDCLQRLSAFCHDADLHAQSCLG